MLPVRVEIVLYETPPVSALLNADAVHAFVLYLSLSGAHLAPRHRDFRDVCTEPLTSCDYSTNPQEGCELLHIVVPPVLVDVSSQSVSGRPCSATFCSE